MSKLDRLGWAVGDWFEISGYRFGVRSTSVAFGEWVRYALGAYLVDGPEDPDDDPLYALVVEDGTSRSGRVSARKLHHFYTGTLDLVRTLDVRVVARSFLAEMESITFPTRDDAVFLEASVIRGGKRTVLIPSFLCPAISAAGRRIQSRIDLALPGHTSVALDPDTGHLIPARRSLDIPRDALEVLGRHVQVGPEEESRAIVDEELPIDRVVVWRSGGEPGVGPAARGPALFTLVRSIRNLRVIGGSGVATLGRVLAGADVLEASWFRTRELVGVIDAVVNGGRYVPDRTEVTSKEP